MATAGGNPHVPTMVATNAVDGQMFNNPQTVGQMSQNPANRWHQFFGPPSGELKTHPYDKYQYETFTMPDAYIGKNIFLRDTIEGFIEGSNNWYTTVALPIQVTDQIHIRWNEWHFDQALASVVPEEGISRLITSSRRGQEDHTIRHGLAFVLEHGFMDTDEGRRQYMLNIQQIAQSVQETNNYDVLATLLNCREYEREWERKHSIIRTPWSEIGKREVMEWGIVQKDPRGFELLHEKYKHRLNRWGVNPNTWIFPPGMALYASFNPVVSEYNKEGGSVTLNTGPEALSTFRGVSVYETREFDVRNGELPINLLQRRVQIGEHYFMRNHHNDPTKFETDNSMSIVVYDEKKDDWAKILYTDALDKAMEHCFDEKGNLLKDMSSPPPDYIFSCRDTNFKGDNTHQFATYWGMLEQGGNEHCNLPDHLPLDCLRAHCASVEARLAPAEVAALNTAIATLSTADEDPANADGLSITNRLSNAVLPLLKFYPAMDFAESGAPNAAAAMRRAVSPTVRLQGQVFARLLFPRPVLYTTADGSPSGDAQVLSNFLNTTFGTSVTMAMVLPSGMAENFDQPAVGNEARAFMYMFEKDGLTKSQAKNFLKEIGGKLKDSYKAAMAATCDECGMASFLDVPATPNAYLTRSAITAAVANAENGDASSHYIQWRTPGGTAGLVEVASIAGELRRAFPQMNTPGGAAATLAAAINAVTATAHLGEEFSVGSKRPASSANASWSKRAATDASSFMEGIGSKYSDAEGKRGTPSGKADFKALADSNWVMSSDHALMHAQNKVQHFARKVGSLSSPIQRIAAHCLYWSKVTSGSINAWSNNNIVPPFSLCLARPYMTYDMCTCILMKGGADTGATFQGHSDFQLGDDVQSKIHYGNYTYYSKAIVTNHKNIIHARNVFCNGYVDGDDTDFVKTDGRGERESGSLFAFIVPYNEHAKSNPMRLFSASEVDPHVRPEHRFGRTMTGGLYYRDKLEVNHNMRVGGDQFTTLSEQNDSNDITYQGHQFFWKEHRESGVNGSYTGCIVNTGHWGRDVYPGCGRVRNGEEVYFEKQHHGQDVY